MTITKIEDLAKNYIDPFNYYYDSDNTEELVNYLQSKIVNWRSGDEIPEKEERLILFIKNIDFPIQSGVYIKKYKRYNARAMKFTPQEVGFWCYESDFLKTL